MTSCIKELIEDIDDIQNFFETDDSYVSANITGTKPGYNNTFFSSNKGVFSPISHPEFNINDDGTFDFKFTRQLMSEDGDIASVNIGWKGREGEPELNKPYSLFEGIDYQLAHVFTKDDIYYAMDGYIVFTKKEKYKSEYRFSGEFTFNARSSDYDEISIQNGTFRDCRICWAVEDECSAKW